MSEATQRVRDFLTKSPSVVYPDDVLGLFEQVELENAKLWEQGARLFDKTLELATENAKLREELEQWHRLTAGIELPEYPITEFKPKDLECENANLRELVGLWLVINKHMSLCATTDCGQCPVREECEESVYFEGLLGIDSTGLSWRVQERMAEATDVQAENAKLRLAGEVDG